MHIIHTHTGEAQRLDRVLAEKAPDFSREEVKQAIKDGFVYVNEEQKVRPSYILHSGDRVVFQLMEFKKSFFAAPGQPPTGETLRPYVTILRAHRDFLGVYKPAGLLVHKTNNPHELSLVDILKEQYPEIHGVGEQGEVDRSGIVHRIDKDTSGVLLIARTAEGYSHLKTQFQTRQVTKRYLALVRGYIARSYGEITYHVARSKTDHTRRTIVTAQSDKRQYSGVPREAKTEYRVQSRGYMYGIPVTQVDIGLHTGRTHQIRLHMKAIGHPILGDKMYGGKWEKHHSRARRQLLHASYIGFWFEGEYYEISSPVPADMRFASSS